MFCAVLRYINEDWCLSAQAELISLARCLAIAWLQSISVGPSSVLLAPSSYTLSLFSSHLSLPFSGPFFLDRRSSPPQWQDLLPPFTTDMNSRGGMNKNKYKFIREKSKILNCNQFSINNTCAIFEWLWYLMSLWHLK